MAHPLPPIPLPATPYPPKPLHAALASLSQQGGSLRDAFALVSRAERQSSPGAAVAVGPEVYVSLLQCCVAAESLAAGRQVHAAAVKRGPYYCRNAYIGTKFAVLYARCGALADADRAFDALPKKNAFAWAAVIGLWSRSGLHDKALHGYVHMLQSGVPADNFVLPNVLKACVGIGIVGVRLGRALHGYAWKAGFMECVYVLSSLVDFYGKLGEVDVAREVFDAMPETTVVTWNSMLMGYINTGRVDDAVELFHQMRLEGVLPDRVSLLSFLSASAEFQSPHWGKQGHAVAVSTGLEMDVILGTSIINFYCKVGLLDAAEAVFEHMVEKDVVTCNLMIAGYLQDGQTDKAFITCRKMLQSGLRFDCVTLASIITSSCGSGMEEIGRAAHGYAVRNNLETDTAVACGLIELYMNTDERTENARRLFDAMSCRRDMVVCKAMISAYAERDMSSQALDVLYQMKHEGISPTAACWDSVISVLIKNERIDKALEIFNDMLLTKTRPNLRTWSLLISGLSRNGMHCEVMNLCHKMQEVEPAPSPTIFSAAILAMKGAASVQCGKAMHACVVKKGLLLSKSVVQSLLNMYDSFSDRGTVESLLSLLAAAQ